MAINRAVEQQHRVAEVQLGRVDELGSATHPHHAALASEASVHRTGKILTTRVAVGHAFVSSGRGRLTRPSETAQNATNVTHDLGGSGMTTSHDRTLASALEEAESFRRFARLARA